MADVFPWAAGPHPSGQSRPRSVCSGRPSHKSHNDSDIWREGGREERREKEREGGREEEREGGRVVRVQGDIARKCSFHVYWY